MTGGRQQRSEKESTSVNSTTEAAHAIPEVLATCAKVVVRLPQVANVRVGAHGVRILPRIRTIPAAASPKFTTAARSIVQWVSVKLAAVRTPAGMWHRST